MRIISRSLIGLTTALALTVVACGDSLVGTDAGVEELTDAEVAAFVDAFFMAFDSAEADVDAQEAAAAPAQVPVEFAGTIEALSVPCETGTVDVSGSFDITFDEEAGTEDGRIAVNFDPTSCLVGEGTTTFTLNGDPHVEIVAEFAADSTGETVDVTVQGGFTFESSDARTGSCAVDVAVHAEISGTGTSVTTISGTVCGVNANTIEAFDGITDEPTQPA